MDYFPSKSQLVTLVVYYSRISQPYELWGLGVPQKYYSFTKISIPSTLRTAGWSLGLGTNSPINLIVPYKYFFVSYDIEILGSTRLQYILIFFSPTNHVTISPRVLYTYITDIFFIHIHFLKFRAALGKPDRDAEWLKHLPVFLLLFHWW